MLAEHMRRRGPVITREKIAGPLYRLALLGRLRAYNLGRHAKQDYQRCCSHFRPLEKTKPNPTVPRIRIGGHLHLSSDYSNRQRHLSSRASRGPARHPPYQTPLSPKAGAVLSAVLGGGARAARPPAPASGFKHRNYGAGRSSRLKRSLAALGAVQRGNGSF